MVDFIRMVLANVLTGLYQPFMFALLVAVLAMQVKKQNPDWKKAVKEWIRWFRTESSFRKQFLLVMYTVMILFRTLLNRSMWANPVSDVIGVWGLYKESGGKMVLTTEVPENLALFIPFAILLLSCDSEERLGRKVSLGSTVRCAAKATFLFSLTIEMLQLFLRLGTWQLSDLYYNTLGGVIGGILYWCFRKRSQNTKQ